MLMGLAKCVDDAMRESHVEIMIPNLQFILIQFIELDDSLGNEFVLDELYLDS